MNEISARDPGSDEDFRLPRRDWILLPLLSLLTICVIALAVESISRRVFQESKTTLFSCLAMNDPSIGVHGIPNSVCSEKVFESELTEYRFNNCGHLAGMECGVKPPGVYRIVLVGSSMAAGLRVPRERTFAALLPAELSRMTGRKVELYNEGVEWGSPHNVDLGFKEALAAKPDMILWTLTPWDIEFASVIATSKREANAAGVPPETPLPVTAASRLRAISYAVRDVWKRTSEWFGHTRSAFMLEHVLYLSQSQYVNHFLQTRGATFLRANLGTNSQRHLREFDGYVADMEAQAAAAGVPLVAVMLPHRAQAAMISTGEWPAGFDPYKMGSQVRSIVESHGATYFDVLPDFRNIPNPERLFFPMDGHANTHGHVVITGLLLEGLTSGPVPELKVALKPRSTSGPGR